MAIKAAKRQVETYEQTIEAARDKITKTSSSLSQYLKTQPKTKDSSVFVSGDTGEERFMARWSVLPTQLMGKFQDQKEDPLLVYRELRRWLVDKPTQINHSHLTRLITRYRDALPDTPVYQVAKDFYAKKLEELNKNVGQSTYTRGTLLALASSCLSPMDALVVDTYLDVHYKDPSMKELAETEIRTKMMDLHKQMNTRPIDAYSGPTAGSKQHNVLFTLAKQGKTSLPKNLLPPSPRPQRGSFSRGRGRGQSNRFSPFNNTGRYQQFDRPRSAPNSPLNRDFPPTRGSSRGGRGQPRGGFGGRGHANNFSNGTGQSQPSRLVPHKTLVPCPLVSPHEKPTTVVKPEIAKSPRKLATEKLASAYDVSKIPAKLDHFGQVEPDIQLLLQHQLIQRDIPIQPNPKVTVLQLFNIIFRLTNLS